MAHLIAACRTAVVPRNGAFARLGIEDLAAPVLRACLRDAGISPDAVDEVIRANRRIPHARAAMHRVRDMAQPVTLQEMMDITEVWVDTALRLGEKSLRTMERLVRAQYRRQGAACGA